ncbi:MAG: hypothetical protein P8J85_14640 [Alphaproteobacteria bacterium]|nr:hypothetical protein [Alphaproteobacteria bacterium]|tara:strand:- start:465 stop:1226 length:762 start_codon:yes stop_codon:yes gene_type:complete
MPFITSAASAKASRKAIDVHGQTYHLSPYVGSAPLRGSYVPGNEQNDDGLPQGFLVEQPSNSITPPHFHDHEQYQVFVDGGARLGRHTANPLSLHYARGHSPYGPITAGPSGVVYFTLRARWDSGAKYMPEARNKLKKVRRKHRMAEDISLPDPDLMGRVASVCRAEVMSTDEDGTCAYLYTIPAGKMTEVDTDTAAGGQYAIVIDGFAVGEQENLTKLSGFYRSPKEAPLEVKAGEDGLVLLLMQFSNMDTA